MMCNSVDNVAVNNNEYYISEINGIFRYIHITDFKKIKLVIDKHINKFLNPVSLKLNQEFAYDSLRNIYNSRKKDPKKVTGFIGEFFMHVILIDLGYENLSFFENLEENSFKKGFDGLYLYNSELWIAESKASNIKSHNELVNIALSDVQKRLNRDPYRLFQNAYNHASIINANTSFTNKILNLVKDYSNGVSHGEKEFNILPVSSKGIKETDDISLIYGKVLDVLKKYNFNKVSILCIDNEVKEDFIKFLNNGN